MSDRILIIGKGVTQQLSSDLMGHFSQVKMIVSSDQSNLPFEVVQQLLMFQSQSHVKIDFMQINAPDESSFNDLLSFHIGLMLGDRENEIAILSDDPSIDAVIEFGKNVGYKVQRMGSGSKAPARNVAASAPQSAPAPQPAPQPVPQPALQPAPQPVTPQPAPQQAPQEPQQAPKKDPNTNKRLISTLIGGSSGLMGK